MCTENLGLVIFHGFSSGFLIHISRGTLFQLYLGIGVTRNDFIKLV